MTLSENIFLYKSLFKGRTDIYAVRWQKDERSGYMPAYKVDWGDYNKHKAQVEILNLYLKDKYETITIHGDDSESSRKSKIEQIKQGHFKIVISTGQYFG